MNDKTYKTNSKNNTYAKNIALLGLFSAFAIILGYIEFLIPLNIPIYGFKLGFANIATVLTLYLFDIKWAGIISIIRIAIINLLFGTVFSLIFSLAGGIISLLGMYLAKRFLRASIVFSSAIGGLLHNFSQLFIAAILLQTEKILLLLGILLVAGLITGILVGIATHLIYIRIHTYMEHIRKGR